MSPSEMKRLTLFEKLIDVFGEEPAVTLMENLPPGGWDQVASKADLQALKAEVNGQFAEVNAKVDVGFAKMDGQFAEFRGQFAAVNGQFAAVNGGFTAVDGMFTALRGEMQGMEGRIGRRIFREVRFAWTTLLAAIVAAGAPLWIELLGGSIG